MKSYCSIFAFSLFVYSLLIQLSWGQDISEGPMGGAVLDYDRGDLIWQLGKEDIGEGAIPASGWVEFDVTITEPGWYVLSFQEMPFFAREILVDGERMAMTFSESVKSAAELQGIPLKDLTVDGWAKEVNLPLEAGEHTIRLARYGRMGFPKGLPRQWSLERASQDAPQDRIYVRVEGYRELRLGEPLKLKVTSGWGDASQYEIYRANMETGEQERVGELDFAESNRFETQVLEIPTPEEGVFQLLAKTGDTYLTHQEFIEGPYFVIDTENRSAPISANAKKKLLYDIDCITNTINGEPVELNVNYWEANGATRISETEAGRYRESGNGMGPETNPLAKNIQNNFSGFSYQFDVPEPGKAYLIEIDHPDDAWRSVCVPFVEYYSFNPEGPSNGYAPRAFAYETGGTLPLSNEMLTESFFTWPNGEKMVLGLASSRIGKRAAAARIRIYEIQEQLPAQTRGADGRFMGLFMEEPERWHNHFNTPPNLEGPVRDFIGLNRVMEWASYIGMNGFWPSVTAYQNTTYPSKELEGYLISHYNTPRLSALLCEKYDMAFAGDIFLARQKYFNDRTMLEGGENPEDLYTTTWWGYRYDPEVQGGILPTWNILHPRVQDKMIAIYGEIADTLGDTESFVGLAGRLMSWRWDGLYALSSLNWGYSDWTIEQFEADTGIQVPGKVDDPERYEVRYRFLTSEAMIENWMEWRNGRVTDFLKRLGARIQEAKPDAVFYLAGSAESDQIHNLSLSENLSERYRSMGIDVDALGPDSGVSIMPIGFFGRGKPRTYYEDQEAYDVFMDPTYSTSGGGAVTSFSHSGFYQEWGTEFPYEKLGMLLKRRPHYCTGSDAAGRNLLERLSVVLAEQDTMAIRQGAYPLLHGRRDFFSEWMAEFSSLPRRSFTPVEFARDPVAVWEREDEEGYLFYMVNRERYPVTITLNLTGAASVQRMGTGEPLPLRMDRLVVRLEPYALQSFKAPHEAKIVDADIAVPTEQIVLLENRLATIRELGAEIEDREDDAAEEYRSRMALAEQALEDGAFWRARTLMASAPMIKIYDDLGSFPEGVVHVRYPNLLEQTVAGRYDPDSPFLDAEDLLGDLETTQGIELVDSSVFDPDWSYTPVIRSEAGSLTFRLDVPVNGFYRLSFGYVVTEPTSLEATLAEGEISKSFEVPEFGLPEKGVFGELKLEAGTLDLTVSAPVDFGVYAVQLEPVLQSLPTTLWSTVGNFGSYWDTSVRRREFQDPLIRQGAEREYGPEKDPSIDATYVDFKGKPVTWSQTEEIIALNEDNGVNFAPREGIISNAIAFAQTFIESPVEQEVILYIGTDWWANAYFNGELLRPAAGEELSQRHGYWYSGWKPRPVRVTLQPGVNRLLIKNQGGSMHSWFTVRMTETGDLRIGPTPESVQ
ncbi:hypothetical protein [Puniceicoccus vermicola]|uniref:Uncharacterized protein n=1 Tax=Puniceicoccus vermicola TaxID=388746 RepID=A0A7X1AZ38_9BACT|nr:hypothetical protein [Puniceicoccus vermicola]MBC2602594.1 hypothetical protein [Puniceicoccus vermicola]